MEKQQHLKAKATELLYAQAHISLLATQSAAVVFIIAMWGKANSNILLNWIAAFSVLNGVRYFQIGAYFKDSKRNADSERWNFRFLVGTTASGSLWGLFAVLVLPVQDPNYTALTILVISGLAGGAIGTYAMSRAAYVIYASTSMLPLCYVLLIQSSDILRLFGILVGIYYLFITATMFRLTPLVNQGVNLQFENLELLKQIENEKDTVLALNKKLQQDIDRRKETEQELLTAKNEAENLADALATLSVLDGLTNITNRRGFDEFLENAWNRGIRNSSPISLIMIDVDYFKAYNDHYGHPAGDEVLRKIATTIEKRTRKGCDLAARYGGEEFAIVLPDNNLGQAEMVAEKIRCAIEQLALPHEQSEIGQYVTASLGIACVLPSRDMPRDMFVVEADKALYAAKTSGRNRIHANPTITPDRS